MHDLVDPAVSQIIASVIFAALSAIGAWLAARLKAEINDKDRANDKMDAIRGCVACMARMQLVEQHDRYIAQGWMPDTARLTVHALHEGYAGMGANGVVDGYMAELRALPTTPPEQTGTD